MVISHPPAGRPRVRWPLWACTIALMVLGGVTAYNTVQLSRMAQEAKQANVDAEMQSLASSVAQLRGAFDAARRQPAPVSEATFSSAQKALGDRLTALEQARDGTARTEDLAALSSRFDALQAHVAAHKAPAAPRKARLSEGAAAREAAPSPPPFTVLGTEMRAGVPFLAVGPSGQASPAQVRLLREGEQESGWRLEVIEPETAVFAVGEQMRRLPLRAR
ncbi:outer membrane murein-binding lipoprotein Lpp [Xanthomonas sacchari]|uniref:hypothetical protein n=1 Tax=unclassified Xanthomonas TaxID=2643310 RepID=UPI00136A8B28|nr:MULTISPECIES: hypothetical protein [unclassified Xanthomonas]MBB6366669.1 outer membrane murein-binding lipoprotein Lpp [Xanthomonas sp. F10]MXV34050.1 hypothetical protein [Xanthomonas sp. LMG 8989]